MTGCSFLRFLVMSSLVVSACATGLAQDSADPQARFNRVNANTSLTDAEMKPWHLKMEFQLYQRDGQPGEKGTVEEWWADPKHHRIVFALPSHTYAAVENGDDSFDTASDGVAPYFAREVLRQAIHPLGNQDVGSVELITKQAGSTKLDCLSVRSKKAVAAKAKGFAPLYCMESGKDALLLSAEFEGEDIARVKSGNFRQRTVPMALNIRAGGKMAASAQIVQLQGQAEPYPESTDTTGLEKQAKGEPSIGNAGGNSIKKIQPIYPAMAKLNQITGTVIISIVIGKDGSVRWPEVVLSPDESLSQAAITAVKQWVYEPYLVDGLAKEVETTVSVNFSMR